MESDKKLINYWISLAQYDFETSEVMLNAGRLLYVGFMCHQTIEKALKACYTKFRDNVPPYSHNLSYLAMESGIYDLLTEDQKLLLDTLDPLNIESRYPDYKKRILESLTYEKCRFLMNRTKELFEWLKHLL
jgi:HEPN domain-containing protein